MKNYHYDYNMRIIKFFGLHSLITKLFFFKV